MADEVDSLDLFADALLAYGTMSLDGEIEIIALPESLEEPVSTEAVTLQVDPVYVEHQREAAAEVAGEVSTVDELDTTLSEERTGQMAFIDSNEWWKVEWQGMPEFVQDNLRPWKTLNVHFLSREDMLAFAVLVQQKMTNETRAMWYPESVRKKHIHLAYMDEAAVARQRKKS